MQLEQVPSSTLKVWQTVQCICKCIAHTLTDTQQDNWQMISLIHNVNQMATLAVDLPNRRDYCLSSTPGEEVLLAYYYFSCICNLALSPLCLSPIYHTVNWGAPEPLNHKHMFQSETAPLVCYFISLPHACGCSCPGFACLLLLDFSCPSWIQQHTNDL